MGLFMAYGFLLIYLRDFAQGKEEWAISYSIALVLIGAIAITASVIWLGVAFLKMNYTTE